ncbi:MAG: hypothetical protein QGG71_17205 [Pirellulaceae bacterium]|nr:hypothetical protein [Pirellulaceae bacterium]
MCRFRFRALIHRRWSCALLAAGYLICFAFTPNAIPQDAKPHPPNEPTGIEHHAWAKFGVGSWKLVRISKETFGTDGKLETMTIQEGKITLTGVKGNWFTLQEEITLEVAGRRFKSATRIIERGLNNETEGQTVTSKSLGKGKVVICQREYPSQVHEITVSDAKSNRVSKLHYSPDVQPFILQRETTFTDKTGKQSNYVATVEVLAVDMPHRVLTEVKPSVYKKTVHTQGNRTKVTLEVSCQNVPGHIVAHTAKIVGQNGRLKERSTLELLDYNVASKQAGARGLGRPRRLGKRRLYGNPR